MTDRPDPWIGKRVEITQTGHPWEGSVGRIANWNAGMRMYVVDLEVEFSGGRSAGVEPGGFRAMTVQA